MRTKSETRRQAILQALDPVPSDITQALASFGQCLLTLLYSQQVPAEQPANPRDGDSRRLGVHGRLWPCSCKQVNILLNS